MRTVLLVGLLWAAGKVLALGKDLLIAYFFGATPQTDAYFIASNIPGLIYAGLLATVPLMLVPLYTVKLKEGGLAEANGYISRVMNWYLGASAIMAAAVYSFAQPLVIFLAPGVPAEVALLAGSLTKLFSVTFVFTMVSAVLTSVQLVHRQIASSQAIPIFNNFIFVLVVFLFAPAFGIYAAAVAATLAWVLQMPIQAFLVRRFYRYSFKWFLTRNDSTLLVITFLPAFVSASVEQISPLISIHFASGLGEGAVSLFTYTMRVISFLSGLFVIITATVSYPEFAHKNAQSDFAGIANDVASSSVLVLFLALSVALIASLFSADIVHILYQRGQFSALHALQASQLLNWLAFAIPFIALREIYLRALYALGSPSSAVLVGLATIALNYSVCMLMVTSYGLHALVIAVLFSSGLSCLLGLAILHVRVVRTFSIAMATTLIRLLGLSAVIWFSLTAIKISDLPLPPFIRLLVGSGVVIALYAMSLYLSGEKAVISQFIRRIGLPVMSRFKGGRD
jgi:putative peptidoglycan lipid II flippase